MPKPFLIIIVATILQAMGVVAHADTVILKSGEMFQTTKAWRQDGSIYFYRNGRVVHYPESDVERLIESKAPPTQTPPAQTPSTQTPPTPDRTIPTPQPLIPRLPIPTGGDTGYLNLKWEQSPLQIKGLRPAGTDAAYGGVQLYTISNGGQRFGRASVDNVFLGFWQGGTVHDPCGGEQLPGLHGPESRGVSSFWHGKGRSGGSGPLPLVRSGFRQASLL